MRRSRRLTALGHSPNCYVDDRLYVDKHTEYSRMYADFQHIPVEEVGDLGAWLEQPPTKLVAVADPADIPALRRRCSTAFGERLFLDDLAPLSPRAREPGSLEGDGHRLRGRASSASRLDRIVSFGDGENDIELIEEAGFGIAVDDANPLLLERADWVCPSADVEGVATVIDAYLESLA